MPWLLNLKYLAESRVAMSPAQRQQAIAESMEALKTCDGMEKLKAAVKTQVNDETAFFRRQSMSRTSMGGRTGSGVKLHEHAYTFIDPETANEVGETETKIKTDTNAKAKAENSAKVETGNVARPAIAVEANIAGESAAAAESTTAGEIHPEPDGSQQYGWAAEVVTNNGVVACRANMQPLKATPARHPVPGTDVMLEMQYAWLYEATVGGEPGAAPTVVGMLDTIVAKRELRGTLSPNAKWVEKETDACLGDIASIEPAGAVGRFDLGDGFSLHCSLPSASNDKPVQKRPLMILGCTVECTTESTPLGKTVEYFEEFEIDLTATSGSTKPPSHSGPPLKDAERREIERDVRMFRRAQGSPLYSNIPDARAISFLAHDRNVDILTPPANGQPVSEAFERLRQCGLLGHYTSIKVWREGGGH